jgi:uncharacterized membrane protein (DUF4010 family)
MNILAEVVKELFGMFVADAALTIATLLLVAIVAGMIVGLLVPPLVAGAVLLVGSIALVVHATWREARRRSS